MIYVGDKKATPYYEDYKPVNVYLNNVKIAGWRVDEKTGTFLEWADTYNDRVLSAVAGGNSTQGGTPTPELPIPIISVGDGGGIDTTVTGQSGQAYTAHRDIILRSLPDGTRDEWDALTGTVTRRVGVKVLDGTENWGHSSLSYTGDLSLMVVKPSSYGAPNSIVLSTHYKHHPNQAKDTCRLGNVGRLIYIFTPTVDSVETYKAWLAAQHAAGTPVTVLYKLATPIIEQIDPAPLPTYPRYTALSCNAEVTASVRVIEHGL